MNWTKIPTNLLVNRTPDNELVAIVKYQLLWAELEQQPEDRVALRYMTNKQLSIVKQWLDTIETQVTSDLKRVNGKRSNRKINYLKNKNLSKIVDTTQDDTVDDTVSSTLTPVDKIRLDKIRIKEKCKKEKTLFEDDVGENEFNEFWKLYTPIKGYDGRFVAKGNKKICNSKFKKLLKEGVKYETIIGGLKRYLEYCQKNGICSCGAEVFINQRRYENDYSGSGAIQGGTSTNASRERFGIIDIAREFIQESSN